MHKTAYKFGRLFFELYGKGFRRVVDLGSQDVNGTLRDHSPPGAQYIGIDLEPGKGVDVVVAPGAPLPIGDASIDAVVSSSAFEHDVCFWETFLELARILRPGGLLYLNAPSNFAFHRYPLDCWRFYPDAGVALAAWAVRRGQPVMLEESFVAEAEEDGWADFVAVFRKSGGPEPDAAVAGQAGRIAQHADATNIFEAGMAEGGKLRSETPALFDQRRAGQLLAMLDERDAALRRGAETAAAQATTEAALRIALLAAEQVAATHAAELAELRDTLARQDQQLAGLNIELAAARAGHAGSVAALAAVHASTSWRATAWLRRMSQAIAPRRH